MLDSIGGPSKDIICIFIIIVMVIFTVIIIIDITISCNIVDHIYRANQKRSFRD